MDQPFVVFAVVEGLPSRCPSGSPVDEEYLDFGGIAQLPPAAVGAGNVEVSQRVADVCLLDDDRRGERLGALADSATALPLPPGFSLDIAGDWEEQQKSFALLRWGLILAVVLMYAVSRVDYSRFRELRYPERVVREVRHLIQMHLRFHTYRSGWSDGAVRRYVRDAGELLDQLNLLTRADCTTQNPAKARALARLQDELEERIARLAEEENLARIRPPLDGHQVMERLGIGPGPLVGEALEHLLEARMERGPIDREEAIRLLDEWWAERGEEAG